MVSKLELRKSFQKLRDEFVSNSAAKNHSFSLSQNILKVVGSEKSVWGSYLPKGSEADPHFEASHITWAYPKIKGELLEFVVPQSKGWDLNDFQIREPKSGDVIKISLLKGILVPGVAFDRAGHRLGSGKGFFDKTLQNFKGKKVGVAYSVQISKSEIPADPHDVKMDVIVTENEVIQVSERKVS